MPSIPFLVKDLRNSSGLAKALSLYFSKKKSEILGAYLFGSVLKNASYAGDIDIAILLTKEAFKKKDTLDWQIDLERDLFKILGKSRIDVVILNNAPLLLRHEILKSKTPLYQRDKETCLDFEVKSELEFYDFQPYRKLFWETLVKRIKEGRLGSV